MLLRLTPLVLIVTVLVVAGVAGGKKGQDIISVPPPTLKNDYLLSRLPATVLRVDSSRMAFADRERTGLLQEVLLHGESRAWHQAAFDSEYVLDAHRSAPALRLLGDVSLNIETPKDGVDKIYSVLLVSRAQGERGEFHIELGTISRSESGWSIERRLARGAELEPVLTLATKKGAPLIQIQRGMEIAELIVIEQRLSDLQARNISDSLYRKWVDRRGIQ